MEATRMTPERSAAEDLLTVLEQRADASRTTFLRFEAEGERPTLDQALPELWGAACRRAGALRELGVGAGERVALVLDTGPEFFELFYGALMLRAVVVPLAPPFAFASMGRYPERVASILRTVMPRVLVVDPRMRHLLAGMLPGDLSLPVVSPAQLEGESCAPEVPRPDDLALIQYTSGSTSRPRGVALTHANLVANSRAIVRAADLGSDDRNVSWLPLFHDMGLIGGVLTAIQAGISSHLMSPGLFVRRPARWLRALSTFRGTISPAPNFAYQLCVDRIADAELEGLDLSCWRRALNGAEPVRPETVRAFEQRFARVGLRPSASLPVYGLAETSLAAAFTPLDRGARIEEVDVEALRDGRADPAVPGRPSRRVVSVGRPLSGSELRIVDAETGASLAERREGEIILRGPSLMRGYFQDPEATAEVLRDGWLWTGDLGYLAHGELYITGRRKSVLIRAGRKYHAGDLEGAAERVPGVRRGCSAAFSVDGEAREELILVVEHSRSAAADTAGLAQRVELAVAASEGLKPDRVLVVPPRSVPKTSSGKVQRSACRELLLSGELGKRTGDRLLQASAVLRGVLRSVAWGLRGPNGHGGRE
jgi:acyl-CoA synthetase (AMP-forming)/AMP-acid ligase II